MSTSYRSARERGQVDSEPGLGGGGSAPSCCAFTHRVAFEEGSGFET